jgi:hypothetical protein
LPSYPTPSPSDFEALAEVEKASDSRVTIIRERAEKWIGGLTALTGLLGTVLVVKGPDAVTKFDTADRVAIAVGFVGALLLLGAGVYYAYSAAFGNAFHPPEFDMGTIIGLHDRVIDARVVAEHDAKKALRDALRSTLGGVALLAVTVGYTWFAPVLASDTKATCVYSGGTQVAKVFGGVTPSLVIQLPEDAEVKTC